MRGRWGFLLGCLLLMGLLCPGESGLGSNLPLKPKLTARFFPDAAPVGGVVDLVLEYRLPKGARLTDRPRIKGLEGLPVEEIETTEEGIRVRMLVDRLAGFKTGPISLAYLSGDGKTRCLTGDPVALTVLSNLKGRPEEAQLRPIRGILPTRSRMLRYLGWALGVLIACGVGLGLLLWLERKGGMRPARSPRVPAHVAAERQIRELASQELFEKGRVKEFYFRLSHILRRYMEQLRGFPAVEYTTEEIALAARSPEDQKIIRLLTDADLVKFADLWPTSAKKTSDVETALGYIRETGAALEWREGTGGASRGSRWRLWGRIRKGGRRGP